MDLNGCKNTESLIKNLQITASVTKHSDSSLLNVHKKFLSVLVQLRYSPGSSKELFIQVTDEDDPLVLLTAVLTETDYQELGLLITFVEFPCHLKNHLNQCSSEGLKDNPKEILVLRVDTEATPPVLSKLSSRESTSLEVIQIGVLRHFPIFSIPLSPATEEVKLRHISSSLKNIKDAISTERNEAQDKESNLSSEVKRLRESLAKKEAENTSLRNEIDQKDVFISNKEEFFIAKETELKDLFLSEYDRKLKIKIGEFEGKLEFERKRSQSAINNLTGRNRNLSMEIKDLKSKISQLEKKNGHYSDVIKKKTEDNRNLALSIKNLKKDLQEEIENGKRLNVENLKFKEALSNQRHDIQALQEDIQYKDRLEDQIERVNNRLKEEEFKHRETEQELKKGIEIIKKFKKQIDSLKAQVKEDEITINKCQTTLSEKMTLVKALEGSAGRLTKECNSYIEELEEAKQKLSQQNKVIEGNQTTISLLNKRLNEAETMGALITKAPLAEAYFPTSNQNVRQLSGNPAALTTSTPLSGLSGHPNFDAVRTHFSLGNSKGIDDISHIPEENDPNILEDRDVPHELPNRYIEPTQRNLQRRGLLRTNSVPLKLNDERPLSRMPPKPPSRGRGAVNNNRGTRSRGNYVRKTNV